jgi:hypothetical protein
MLEQLFAIIALIPQLNDIFEKHSKLYFDWKYRKNDAELTSAVEKALEEDNTKDLQKEFGDKL